MSDNDINFVLICIILGIINIFLGGFIKSYKMADILFVYNPKIHDRQKISNISGNIFLVLGVIVILMTGVFSLMHDKINLLNFFWIMISILTFGIISEMFISNKYGKK